MQHQFIDPTAEASLDQSKPDKNGNRRDERQQERAASLLPQVSSAWIESQGMIANPSRGESGSQQLMTRPSCICLNIEDLKSFEVVERQFLSWGVELSNAIALHPSNDAYPPRSGKMVLIGAPKSGWMEMTFKRPVSFFNCYATGSQRIVLLAYDNCGQVLTQGEISEPNLGKSDSKIAPNAQLCAIAERAEIARVTLYAFDGQMTVDDLSFGFWDS